jgi:hypothetical protein
VMKDLNNLAIISLFLPLEFFPLMSPKISKASAITANGAKFGMISPFLFF